MGLYGLMISSTFKDTKFFTNIVFFLTGLIKWDKSWFQVSGFRFQVSGFRFQVVENANRFLFR